MPYSNIVWIKLHLELFDEDDRFLYQLTERQQLLYIKLLYLAGRQQNKISKNPQLIIQKVNYQGTTQDLLGDIEQIKKVFSKFKETKYFYTFTKFEEIHNRIKERNSKGTPKELQRGIPDKDKEVDKIKSKSKTPKLTDTQFLETLKTNPVYQGIDIDRELGKMDAWLLINPGRQKNRRFILNWLNKIDKPIDIKKESKLRAVDPGCKLCKGTGFIYNQSKSANEICQCRLKRRGE